MNTVEEWVVTLGFNKDNPRNFPTPSNQQSQGQPTKVVPPKAKGAKSYLGGGPHPIKWNKVEKTNVGGVVGLIRKKIVPI